MDVPGLQIAVLGALQQAPDEEAQYLISGPARSWFRRKRTEPLAACFSLTGDPAKIEDLIETIEETFRTAARYSVTSSLSRALLAAHSRLLRDNQLSLVQHRSYASALVAVARPNGVYVARVGPTCVAALRSGQLVARAADAVGRSPADSPEMGYPTTPQVATEFYPLDTGDGLVLVPGPSGAEMSERALTAALDGLPHLVLADALIDGAPGTTNGVVVWRPRTADEEPSAERWIQWAGAPNFEALERDERPPLQIEPEPEPIEPTGPFTPPPPVPRTEPVTEATSHTEPSMSARLAASGERLREMSTAGLATARSAGWVLPILGLALVLIVALLVIRAGLPTPGGATQTIADAGRIMQEAQANPDPEVSAGLLDQAIAMLDPLAANNQGARALLADARRTQDQILHIVRVTRPQRANFPSLPDFRPAGLWRTPDHLLILDLGGQVLYRTNHAGEQMEIALRPGETVEGQPTGRLVTAAWSPPRGANSEGQLVVIDHVRSILSLDNAGTPARRWWPPDNAAWQRLGASAASYDDLFVLDTNREELWRYPARLPGAAGSVALRAAEDLPLGSAVDVATDGNLYLLFSDGEIVKQAPSSGRLPFDAAVPHRPLRAPTAIYAHPDLDHIWVLEPAEARVVELTNQGSYVRQFVFPPELMRNAVGLHVQASQELRVLTTQSILLVQMD